MASGNSGKAEGKQLEAAQRLREVVWDHELAYLAFELTKLCSVKDEFCASTVRFPEVQHSITKVDMSEPTAIGIIENTFKAWRDSKKEANIDSGRLPNKEELRKK